MDSIVLNQHGKGKWFAMGDSSWSPKSGEERAETQFQAISLYSPTRAILCPRSEPEKRKTLADRTDAN
jgi:hypothetical protein